MLDLTEEVFERWWSTSVRPEDQDEYVHGPWRGTLEGARFCAAYDILRTKRGEQGEHSPHDLVVKAYVISLNMAESCLREATVRIAAQGMYDEDSVRFLLDKVEYRKRAEAEERIASLAVAKIEELDKRAANGENFDEYDDRIKTEKLLLDASLRFLSDRTTQKKIDMQRRERRALRDSIADGKKQLKNVTQLPSKDEIRQFFQMAREMLTESEFDELSGRKALSDGH